MNQITKKRAIGNSVLLLTAVIWGASFVAQRTGMEYVGPLTFTCARFWLSVAVLIPLAYLTDKAEKKAQKEIEGSSCSILESGLIPAVQKNNKTLLTSGCICGIILFFGSVLQQYGLVFTTAGKAAFITALYILLVPIFGLFLRHRFAPKVWAGVAFGTVGLYFLAITESFTIAWGDLVVLIGAFFWACHVLVIDHFIPYVSAVKLALVQFFICAVLATAAMLLFENPNMDAIISCTIPIVYTGVLSGGAGFTLQIVGQKYTTPAIASLLLSMEAVFGAVFGFLILREIMTGRELSGCILMLAAIIISQFPQRVRAEQEVKNEHL